MTRQLALLICVSFIAWLFARDRRLRPMTSGALWIPLVWILIIASRPVSFWIGGGILIDKPDDYVDGSPVDRNVFFLLIATGLVVLFRRGVNWSDLIGNNRCLFAFFFFCGISAIWSDYPFVSFKRWIKDLGNVVMILVILTEKDPVQAFRAVFAR